MAETLWLTDERGGWRFELLVAGAGLSQLTDVQVTAPSGQRWAGTVGTLAAIAAIMRGYIETGECLGGAHFWASGLLILRDDDELAAIDALESLVISGEHEDCFEEIESAE